MVTECKNSSPESEKSKRRKYYTDKKRCSLPTTPTYSLVSRSSIEPNGINKSQSSKKIPCSVFMPEILTHIFQFLPLEDRKNVRLVDKLWYECCTRPLITSREKFVFRADCSLPDIVAVFLNSNLMRMNVEFQDVEMDSLSASIWESCGYRMYSIHFYRCYLNENTLRNIIVHCTNLASVNIYKDRDFDSNLKSLMVLDYFIKQGIKRTQLHTFSVIARHSISIDLLKKIFEVFPCITHFSTRVKSPDDGEEAICLQSSIQLQSLTFSRGAHLNDLFWLEKPTIPIWQLRLTKFETNLYGVHWTDARRKILLRFFSVQKDLKIIFLEMREARFIKELTFHILRNCPKLREFRISCQGSELQLSCEEIEKFLSLISNLRCLMITCTFRIQSVPPLMSKNLALEVLSLRNVCRNEEFFSYILKHCSKVKHLQLSWPSDNILQEIFKVVPDLQTLILDDAYNCTKCGFIGKGDDYANGYSIKRLQKLEHLEICGAAELTKDIARECQFPHLKYLRCVNIDLSELVSNMPRLETLVLYWYELNELEETIKLCESLKNLSRLRVGNISMNTLKPLFEACPNLRYVWNQCEVFSFNRFTKQLSRSFEINFKFPGKESVFEG